MTAAIAIITIATWFWLSSLKAREIALHAGARACRQADVQLLDQTISLKQLRLRRDPLTGRMAFHRHYIFEFSVDGGNRFPGHVVLAGRRIASLSLEHPEGRLVLK